jgi:hypothetical protein
MCRFDSCASQLTSAGLEIKSPLHPDLSGTEGHAHVVDEASSYNGSDHQALTAVAGVPADRGFHTGPGASFKDVQKALSEFTRTTQRALEQERADLLVRCTAAEEKTKQMETYIATKMSAYQEEIVRLRKFVR